MADVKVSLIPNGPMKVSGPIDLAWADGTPVPNEKSTVYLCRCGASVNKPFCDGAHSRIGFEAAAEAVPESQEEDA
jgi:CDGSH-type Zn-finger protein